MAEDVAASPRPLAAAAASAAAAKSCSSPSPPHAEEAEAGGGVSARTNREPGEKEDNKAPPPLGVGGSRWSGSVRVRSQWGAVPENVEIDPTRPSPESSVAFSQSPAAPAAKAADTAGALDFIPPTKRSKVCRRRRESLSSDDDDDDGDGFFGPAKPKAKIYEGRDTPQESAADSNRSKPKRRNSGGVDNTNTNIGSVTGTNGPKSGAGTKKKLGAKWGALFADMSDSSGGASSSSEASASGERGPSKKRLAGGDRNNWPRDVAESEESGSSRNGESRKSATSRKLAACRNGGSSSIDPRNDNPNHSRVDNSQVIESRNDAKRNSDDLWGDFDDERIRKNKKVRNVAPPNDSKKERHEFVRSNVGDDRDDSAEDSDGDDDASAAGPKTVASADRSTPRNPLALMRESMRDASTPADESTRLLDDGTDALWSDDDDDVIIQNPICSENSKKKRGRVAATKRRTPLSSTSSTNGDDLAAGVLKSDSKQRRVAPKQPPAPIPRRLLVEEEENEMVDIEEAKSELKPSFSGEPKFGPYALESYEIGRDKNSGEIFEVPASINRYLPPYQQIGVDFLFRNIVSGTGAILGDDMGLGKVSSTHYLCYLVRYILCQPQVPHQDHISFSSGKTVQVISLLAALLKKTGTGLDLIELRRRKKLAQQKLSEFYTAKEAALREGRILMQPDNGGDEIELPGFAPILIIVPPSVVGHWEGDFANWGHFAVEKFQKKVDVDIGLEMIRSGESEILLCSKSMFMDESVTEALCEINWKLVIVDEFHLFKNSKGSLANNLRLLKRRQGCVVSGLTGTLMQNDHKELW